MATFGQICESVYTITNRPELVEETKRAVINATQFFHLFDHWQRDCDERLLSYAQAAFLFQIDIPNTLERFRDIRYIKKYDVATQTTKESESEKIKRIDPDQLFDRYGAVKQNVFYLAGKNLNLRLSSQETDLLVSWYKYPNTTPEGYNSWIAEMMDGVIINKAAAEIQRAIGMTDDANRREKWAIEIDLGQVAKNDLPRG